MFIFHVLVGVLQGEESGEESGKQRLFGKYDNIKKERTAEKYTGIILAAST